MSTKKSLELSPVLTHRSTTSTKIDIKPKNKSKRITSEITTTPVNFNGVPHSPVPKPHTPIALKKVLSINPIRKMMTLDQDSTQK